MNHSAGAAQENRIISVKQNWKGYYFLSEFSIYYVAMKDVINGPTNIIYFKQINKLYKR